MKKSFLAILLTMALLSSLVIGTGAQTPDAGSWIGVYGATVTDSSAGTSIAFSDSIYAMRAGYNKQFNLDGFRMRLTDITGDAGVRIPMSFGSMTGDQVPYTWTDKVCMTLVVDLAAGAYALVPNNLQGVNVIYSEVADPIGNELYVAFEKTQTAWTISVNGNATTIPNEFMNACVPNTAAATMAIGGDWNWDTGDKDISYTIKHLSSYAAYTVDVGTPNIKAADMEDHWGTGLGFADVAKGVKITTDSFGKRVNTKNATAIDGMIIKLTDVSHAAYTTETDGTALAITVTKDLGGFTNGGSGVFFRINETSTGQVFLNAALSKDNCDNEASRIINNYELGGSFTRGLPANIEIRFVKNGTKYDVHLNDQVVSLDAAAVEGEILSNKTAYVSFGGWNTVDASYVVNYVYSANTPAPTASETKSTATSASSTASTTGVKAPQTSDSSSAVTMITLLAVMCISSSLLLFTKKARCK